MASSADPPAGAGADGSGPAPPGWPRAALFSLKDKGEGGASPPVLGGFPPPGRGALAALRVTAGRIFDPSSSPGGGAPSGGNGGTPVPPPVVYAALSGVGASGGPLLALLPDDAALETVSMN